MGVFLAKLAWLLLDLIIWWAIIIASTFFQYRWYEKAKTEKLKNCLDSSIHITIYLVSPVAIIGLTILYFCGICIPFPL